MRCGTPGTSGHVTTKSSIRAVGVLYKSGAYARTVLCLTLGDLPAVRPSACAHGELSEGRPEPIGRQKSAEGIVSTLCTEGPNGSHKGLKERSRGLWWSGEMASGEVPGSCPASGMNSPLALWEKTLRLGCTHHLD
jgi:hypothetical protein